MTTCLAEVRRGAPLAAGIRCSARNVTVRVRCGQNRREVARVRSKWMILASGACLFQLTNCMQTAAETVVRIGFDLVFLPLNQAIVSAF